MEADIDFNRLMEINEAKKKGVKKREKKPLHQRLMLDKIMAATKSGLSMETLKNSKTEQIKDAKQPAQRKIIYNGVFMTKEELEEYKFLERMLKTAEEMKEYLEEIVTGFEDAADVHEILKSKFRTKRRSRNLRHKNFVHAIPNRALYEGYTEEDKLHEMLMKDISINYRMYCLKERYSFPGEITVSNKANRRKFRPYKQKQFKRFLP